MTDSKSALERRIGQARLLGEAICVALRQELEKQGFGDPERLAWEFDHAEFELSRDPFDGRESLKGTWRGARGNTAGSLIFYPDGAFYAEYDVIKPHPTKAQWFVEAVTAWGRGNQIKTEARLLPAL